MNAMTSLKTALVVADDSLMSSIRPTFATAQWGLKNNSDPDEALEMMFEGNWACVIVIDNPKNTRVREFMTGLESAPVPILVVVKPGDVSTAVYAMKHNATEVIEQDLTRLNGDVLVSRTHDLTAEHPVSAGPERDVVRSTTSPLQPILDMIPQIAKADAPILITGESGTGKELLAQIIHKASPRAEGPFIAVNCGAIPNELFESELFGHVKGAFTGATSDKVGMFEAAHGGTIFLDEIAELPLAIQVKLLRVLADKKITPVGSTTAREIDFRIISSTNRDIERESRAGHFREDLYYRVSVLPVHLPPLRERIIDIPVLAEHFIEELNETQGTSITGISPEARTLLKRYPWPGNVRELQNIIQRICILKQTGQILHTDLPESLSKSPPALPVTAFDLPSEGMDMPDTFDRLEVRLLILALKKCDGNKARAARLLGLNRTTFVEKLKRKRIEYDPELDVED
jgi:DNA-binding NtrC family response regulator